MKNIQFKVTLNPTVVIVLFVATAILVSAKIADLITAPWWLVTVLLWAPAAIALSGFLLLGLGTTIVFIAAALTDEHHSRKASKKYARLRNAQREISKRTRSEEAQVRAQYLTSLRK